MMHEYTGGENPLSIGHHLDDKTRRVNYRLLNMIGNLELLHSQVEQIVDLLQVREAGQDMGFMPSKKQE